MNTYRSKKLHIAILASPGMGHLIPGIVIGNRLATQYDVKITVLAITTTEVSIGNLNRNLGFGSKLQDFDILEIPPVDISHLIDANTKISARIRIIVREALPGLRASIAGMKDRRPDILICDLFCTKAFTVADEFDMPKYLYIPTNAWFSALQAYSPVLHQQIDGQYVDQTQPLKIPGCNPVRPADVSDAMLDRNDLPYRGFLETAMEYGLADGILMNTWEDLEPVTLEAFRKNEFLRDVIRNTTVYPIGPITRPPLLQPAAELNCSDHQLMMKWLDKQPSESVLFVSFGSGGTLSAQQLTELAFGLELSKQRFIWVVRPPATKVDESFFSGTGIFEGHSPRDFYYLPEGFLTRTKNTGWIVREWAEQVEILSHSSVGGFMTHCGWGSTLESITNGVPMIAWPLYSEQRQNATMLVEELRVAVRPEVLPTKKVVDRKEVEKMVRIIMESDEGVVIRDRVKQLKVSGEKAINKGGSSYSAMSNFLQDAHTRLKRSLSS